MPTDLEQATGLERLEILGKMQGVDIFDMSPLDSSRKGMWNLFIDPVVKWKELNMFLGAEGGESNVNAYGGNRVGTHASKKRDRSLKVRGQG